jgi:hypothetical protein
MGSREKRLNGLIETTPTSRTMLKQRAKTGTVRIEDADPTERLYAHMMSTLHME